MLPQNTSESFTPAKIYSSLNRTKPRLDSQFTFKALLIGATIYLSFLKVASAQNINSSTALGVTINGTHYLVDLSKYETNIFECMKNSIFNAVFNATLHTFNSVDNLIPLQDFHGHGDMIYRDFTQAIQNATKEWLFEIYQNCTNAAIHKNNIAAAIVAAVFGAIALIIVGCVLGYVIQSACKKRRHREREVNMAIAQEITKDIETRLPQNQDEEPAKDSSLEAPRLR